MAHTFLGIVLGGTRLMIGEIGSQGELLKKKDYNTVFFNQASAQDMIISSLHDYESHVGWIGAKPVAMGVGLIGRVDSERGIWQQIRSESTRLNSSHANISYAVFCLKKKKRSQAVPFYVGC